MNVLSQISGVETFFDPGIINAQELVLSGGHVDEVGLALGAFLVQELVDRLVSGGLAKIGADDLVQGLAQMGRSALSGWIALGDVLAGVIHSRINTGESGDRAALGKAAHIANLRNQLRAARNGAAWLGSASFSARRNRLEKFLNRRIISFIAAKA